MDQEAVVVLITAGSGAEAERVALALLEARLAACANLVPGVTSLYWWEGKIDRAEEVLLLVKTRRGLVPRLVEAVRGVHSYQVFAAVAVPIEGGNPAYWTGSEARPPSAGERHDRRGQGSLPGGAGKHVPLALGSLDPAARDRRAPHPVPGRAVVGNSMLPTLHPGQALLVDRYYYRLTGMFPNDLVVMHHDGELWIKRLVGLPGDKIALVYGPEGTIDGVLNLHSRLKPPPGARIVTVEPGHLFILGDNMGISQDSRVAGPLPVSDLLGIVRTPTMGRFWAPPGTPASQ